MDPQSLLQVITGFTAAGALLTGAVIILRQYIVKHYQSSLYLALSWIGFFLEALFGSASKMSPASIDGQILVRLSYLALVPAFLGVLTLVGSLYKPSIELKSFITIMLVLGINGFILIISPGDQVIQISYYILVTVGFVMSITSYLIYIRIYKRAPPNLRRSARLNLVGAFSVSFLYVFLNILESRLPGIFPPISRIFEAGGALTQSFVFARNEQLFYILLVKTQRLVILNSNSGMTIYSHDWSKKVMLVSNELLAGMLQGMMLIINESVGKGKVVELKLDRGFLLLYHDEIYPVTAILITSRPVKVLNQGLALFVRRFTDRFKEQLGNPKQVEDASDLIRECFPFVPQYM